jgi:hypothetical protein
MDEGIATHNLVFIIVASVLVLVIADYGIDMHKLYPMWVMEMFEEPIVRFMLYVAIYLLACFNPVLSILLALVVIFLHIDYINLAKAS